jgi:hypothetical protein
MVDCLTTARVGDDDCLMTAMQQKLSQLIQQIGGLGRLINDNNTTFILLSGLAATELLFSRLVSQKINGQWQTAQ